METKDWISLAVQVIGFAAAFIGAIYAARKGAREGAIQSYDLSKQMASEREQQQEAAVRLLISLEIKQNLFDLTSLLEELERLGQGAAAQERQRQFIAAHYPGWSHRFWHAQQSTSVLPTALEAREILNVSFFYSLFDTLDRIVARLRRADEPSMSDDPARRLTLPAANADEASTLWAEFFGTTEQVKNLGSELINQLDRPQVVTDGSLRSSLPLRVGARNAER